MVNAIPNEKRVMDLFRETANIAHTVDLLSKEGVRTSAYQVRKILSANGVGRLMGPKDKPMWVDKVLASQKATTGHIIKRRFAPRPNRRKKFGIAEAEVIPKEVPSLLERFVPSKPSALVPDKVASPGEVLVERVVKVHLAQLVGQNREKSRECLFCREKGDALFQSRGQAHICKTCVSVLAKSC